MAFMRAFEIYVNGKRLCVAGVNNASVLSAIIDYVGRDDEERLHLHVGGLLIPEGRSHAHRTRRVGER